MDLGLTDSNVVITGGTRGIGWACAALFAAEGAHVTVVGRSRAPFDAAIATLPDETVSRIFFAQADMASGSALASLHDTFRRADILVNNAGAIPGGDLEKVDDETWRQAWELKVFGYIDACRATLPAMVKRGSGVIVNVIGMAGANPRYDYLCGSTANAGLIAFTKAAGAYSSQHGVRVVGVNPGPTATDRLKTLYMKRAEARFGSSDNWESLLADLPFGRPAMPEEMADLVVYLASKRASYLSGIVIDADGGAMHAG